MEFDKIPIIWKEYKIFRKEKLLIRIYPLINDKREGKKEMISMISNYRSFESIKICTNKHPFFVSLYFSGWNKIFSIENSE